MSITRERILDVAGDLFFRHGYHAIGIDLIIASSEVAKATLYRHFPSKDDLIAAYLERSNTRYWDWFDAAAAPFDGHPREQILAVFRALQTLVTSPTCYGCPFLIAATEFPEPTHPGHRIAQQHKDSVRERLRGLCRAAGAVDPDQLGDHLFLLMDGAFLAVRMYGVSNPAAQVGDQAHVLLNCLLTPPNR